MDTLPFELRIKILRSFTQRELFNVIANISKNMRRSSLDPLFWKTVNFSDNNWQWVRELPNPVRNCVSELCLEDRAVAPSIVSRLVTIFPLVQTVNIDFGDRDCSRMLNGVLVQITRWERLKAVSVEAEEDLIDINKNLIRLVKECPDIEEIRVTKGGTIRDSFLLNLQELRIDKLKCLNLYCFDLTEKGFRSLTTGFLSNLTTLYLDYAIHLTDDSIIFLKKMTNLEKLAISASHLLTAKGIENVLRDAPFLDRLIELSRGEPINRAIIELISTRCLKLRFWNIVVAANVTDVDLIPITLNCANLQKLIVRYGDKITGECFVKSSKVLPNLVSLRFKCCRMIKKRDDIILKLIRRWPNVSFE